MHIAQTTRRIFAVSFSFGLLNDKQQLLHTFQNTTGWQCRRFRWIGIAETNLNVSEFFK